MPNLEIEKWEFREDELTSGVQIKMIGELVYDEAHDFMKSVPEMVRGAGHKIILDMERLKYIDSSGLGAILYISEALRMQGQQLEIHNANEYNLKVIRTINKVGTFKLVEK